MTEPVKARQLTVAQENAIDALLLGNSDGEAAQIAGVSRQTVWGWRTWHPYFRLELEKRRTALFREAKDRLRALLPKALARLEKELENDEGDWRAAAQVLKIGNFGAGRFAGASLSGDAMVRAHAYARRGSGLDSIMQQARDDQEGRNPSDEEMQDALEYLLRKAEGEE